MIVGGIVLLPALATFLFLWRWTVQNYRLAEKQKQLAVRQKQLAEKQNRPAETYILQLEQEKQFIATQSLLEGETTECARIAACNGILNIDSSPGKGTEVNCELRIAN